MSAVSVPHRRSKLACSLVLPRKDGPRPRSYMQSLTLADPLGLRERSCTATEASRRNGQPRVTPVAQPRAA